MTDQAVNPAGQAAPATPATQTHAAAPAAVPASDAAKPADPNWLNGRIAQAKTSATTELLVAWRELRRRSEGGRRGCSSCGRSEEDRRAAGPRARRAAEERGAATRQARRRHQGARGARARRSRPSSSQPSPASRERTRRAAARDRHAEADLGLERVRNDCAARGCRSANHEHRTGANGSAGHHAEPNGHALRSLRRAAENQPFAAAEYLRQHGAAIAEGK